jgi:hypothetical protein
VSLQRRSSLTAHRTLPASGIRVYSFVKTANGVAPNGTWPEFLKHSASGLYSLTEYWYSAAPCVSLMLADGASYSMIEQALPCFRDYINR